MSTQTNEPSSKVDIQAFVDEISRRGGEVSIEEKGRSVPLSLTDQDSTAGVFLLKAEGWRHYSNRVPARWAGIAYLCGTDDNGLWATRVPTSVKSVQDGLRWITPTAVHSAHRAGRSVARQGDVYAVEASNKRFDTPTGWINNSHHWDQETRTLTHHPQDGETPHAPLVCPGPVRFHEQIAFGMGRGARQGFGMAD